MYNTLDPVLKSLGRALSNCYDHALNAPQPERWSGLLDRLAASMSRDRDEIEKGMLSQCSVAQELNLPAPGRYKLPKAIKCRGAKPGRSGVVLQLELANGALVHLPFADEATRTVATFLETFTGRRKAGGGPP
jgi:hypothetical protein